MLEGFDSIDVFAVFVLGLATGLLLPLLSGHRGRQVLLEAIGPSRRYAILAVGTLAVLPIVALVAEHREGSGVVASVPATMPAMTAAAPMAGGSGAPTAAGSMEIAVTELGARLATLGGSDADWDLLAQSYDFLGRASDAALARQHKVPTERSLQDAVAVSARVLGRGLPGVPASTVPVRGDVTELLTQAEEHRRKREFQQACEVYAVVVERGGMTADAWADYADAQAGASGSLAGAPGRAIDAALAIDPRHPKALWLKASLAHEEGRYDDARRTWQELLVVVQPGSSDARIVTANIAEATLLASK